MAIDRIIPDPANARRRDDRAKKALASSLRRFGAARSIVLDGGDVVRAGNGTLEAFAAAGGKEVVVVEAADDQIVAVRKPGWSASDAADYAIADNRTSELAEWDDTVLATALESMRSDEKRLGAVGFTAREAQKMIDGLADKLTLEKASERSPKLQAFIAARRKSMERFKDKVDTNFWVCLVFQSYDQKCEFLKALDGVPVVYGQYVDGQAFAERVGVDIGKCRALPFSSPLDATLTDMVISSE